MGIAWVFRYSPDGEGARVRPEILGLASNGQIVFSA